MTSSAPTLYALARSLPALQSGNTETIGLEHETNPRNRYGRYVPKIFTFD